MCNPAEILPHQMEKHLSNLAVMAGVLFMDREAVQKQKSLALKIGPLS